MTDTTHIALSPDNADLIRDLADHQHETPTEVANTLIALWKQHVDAAEEEAATDADLARIASALERCASALETLAQRHTTHEE